MPFEIRIEEIKPKPANYPLNLVKALEAEIQKALTGPVKTEVKRAFEKRTGDWKRRPEWVARYAYQALAGGRDPSLTVYPRGRHRKVYEWVTLGTRSYPIVARYAPMLRYRRYSSRTKAGNLYGRRGYYYGPVIVKKAVIHPGIKAREFEKHIAKEETPGIERQIRLAIARALK